MSKNTKRQSSIKASNIWKCLACENEPEFEHKEMMEHLRSVHQIETRGTKAKRSMLYHLDGDDYFSSTWEWEINGMKFIQYTTNPRKKSDPMNFI